MHFKRRTDSTYKWPGSGGWVTGFLSLGQIGNEEQLRGVIEYCFPKTVDLADLRNRLISERQNFSRSLRTLTKAVSDEDLERQQRNNDWPKARDERLIELAQGLWATWVVRAEAWKSKLNDAENSIKTVENQYTELMELKAPVEYWKTQAKNTVAIL